MQRVVERLRKLRAEAIELAVEGAARIDHQLDPGAQLVMGDGKQIGSSHEVQPAWDSEILFGGLPRECNRFWADDLVGARYEYSRMSFVPGFTPLSVKAFHVPGGMFSCLRRISSLVMVGSRGSVCLPDEILVWQRRRSR